MGAIADPPTQVADGEIVAVPQTPIGIGVAQQQGDGVVVGALSGVFLQQQLAVPHAVGDGVVVEVKPDVELVEFSLVAVVEGEQQVALQSTSPGFHGETVSAVSAAPHWHW